MVSNSSAPSVSTPHIYVDHAAGTFTRPEAVEAMRPYFEETAGNPSSLHLAGQKARRAVEEARERVAAALGAHADEIIFTSGGTESDNLAVFGSIVFSKRRGVITSGIEHKAILGPCEALRREGAEVAYLPVNAHGVIQIDALKAALRDEAGLLTVMLANNETGVLQPVREVAALAHERNVPVHTDAVQAAGKVAVNVDELGVDLMSISAHKFGGPKGAGALYVRKGTRLSPLLYGGHQERDLRPGTENVAAIAGMARALELAVVELSHVPDFLASLRDQLQEEILAAIPGTHVNGAEAPRVPHLLNLAFEGVEADALLMALDMRGISVSTGSACTSGAPEGSHVLKAMGTPAALARGSLRFSVGRGNTTEQMTAVVKALSEIIPILRANSPFSGRQQ